MKYYVNTLDKIRLYKGNNALNHFFNGLSENNDEEAIRVLNDANLHFTSLFYLQPTISKFKLLNKLSQRNKLALLITNEILSGKEKLLTRKNLSKEKRNYIISTLKWIFLTGIQDDGLSPNLDKVLDITTIILSKECKDISILPIIVNTCFKRYRSDYYFYDLIWAFFQSKSPESLVLIAPYILSKNEKDIELATRLLNFIPDIDLNLIDSKSKKYYTFMKWIKENHHFLYFTGESLQRRYDPKPYKLSLEGKYLCKHVSVDTGRIISKLTNKELQLLREFKKETYENRKILSEFSHKLNQRDLYQWNKWINSPLKIQLDIVKKRRRSLH